MSRRQVASGLLDRISALAYVVRYCIWVCALVKARAFNTAADKEVAARRRPRNPSRANLRDLA
jgi:hypothetical protein